MSEESTEIREACALTYKLIKDCKIDNYEEFEGNTEPFQVVLQQEINTYYTLFIQVKDDIENIIKVRLHKLYMN